MTVAQSRASDPKNSVWVAANAGTGKTKVLTDRVLRLLLDGVAPDTILCLTFTKAAANEMAARIQRELTQWVVASDLDLKAMLCRLKGEKEISDACLLLARELFVRVLDMSQGLQIQTIHSFCQSLVQRFPIEAQVPSHFELIDDRTVLELLKEARMQVLDMVSSGSVEEGALRDAFSMLAVNVSEYGVFELLQEVLSKRDLFYSLLDMHGGVDQAVSALYRYLDIDSDMTEYKVVTQFCADASMDLVLGKRLLAALLQGNQHDKKRGAVLERWLLASEHERTLLVDTYVSLFVTQKGEPKKVGSVITKVARETDAVVEAFVCQEQTRILEYLHCRSSVALASSSCALIVVVEAVLSRYRVIKHRRGVLDYDDLIEAAYRLLHSESVAQWVLYKLDQSIDHVLVDEAQDTSFVQWQLVHMLCGEFFSGQGSHDVPRTLFVVGDEKQSIYRFQGADPEAFDSMHGVLSEAAISAMHPWCSIGLEHSFRSTAAVLHVVDAVFSDAQLRSSVSSSGAPVVHSVYREGQAGVVELWPLTVAESYQDRGIWDMPVVQRKLSHAKSLLAERIARTISEWLSSERMLDAKGRPVQPRDIMILVRSRSDFMELLVQAMKQFDVPVAGVDRMVLHEQVVVEDLLSLASFLLLPEDDLALAEVLRCPLVGLSEEALFVLAEGRDDCSLWSRLQRYAGAAPYDAAYYYLTALLSVVDFHAPFDLFYRVLEERGGRKIFASRLGNEIHDSLDEFLSLCLAYEQVHQPTLQGFLSWMQLGDMEVKRDLSQDAGAVRVMTVHGSKGLQAPIVFMPDTVSVPMFRDRVLFDDGAMYWAPSVRERNDYFEQVKERMVEENLAEYWRLLYVAMTRAEDELYIGGVSAGKAVSEHSWYRCVDRAFLHLGDQVKMVDEGVRQYCVVQEASRTVLCKAESDGGGALVLEEDLPCWLDDHLTNEAEVLDVVRPSHVGVSDRDLSPLSFADDWSSSRGTIIHRLLQYLPDVPFEQREALAWRYVRLHSLEDADTIVSSVLRFLRDPSVQPLFGPSSLAEVPVRGLLKDGRMVSGQVDRLVVQGDELWVVDYKTSCFVPDSVGAVPFAYIQQLYYYREVLRQLYPGYRVCCMLVWTEGPRLMVLPDSSFIRVIETSERVQEQPALL